MPRLTMLLFLVLAAGFTALASGCASDDAYDARYRMTASANGKLPTSPAQAAPMDPARSIVDRDCSQPIDQFAGGNLRCQ